MYWNYRIIRYSNKALGLHEVHYNNQGKPKYRTSELATFACDDEEGADGIVKSLQIALNDAQSKSILDDFVKDG